MPPDNSPAPGEIHPSLWLASQLARANTPVVSSGHAALDNQLPGGGWPKGAMTELLCSQNGGGEMRLVAPVFRTAGKRRVVLIQPPCTPNALALAGLGLAPSQVIWVQPDRTSDGLWTAEQCLKSGGFAAVLLWQTHCRNESLRRLNVAASDGSSVFFLFRPIAAAQDPSPAPLRLTIRPAQGGVQIDVVKRRGPTREGLFLPLSPSFIRHAPLDRPTSVPATARSVRTEVVE